ESASYPSDFCRSTTGVMWLTGREASKQFVFLIGRPVTAGAMQDRRNLEEARSRLIRFHQVNAQGGRADLRLGLRVWPVPWTRGGADVAVERRYQAQHGRDR